MPNDPAATSVNLQDAPGANLSLDDLFPVDPASNMSADPQGPTSGTPLQPPQAPQTPPPPPEFFLKAGHSVYKTADEAARGIEHKDTLIDRYRSYLEQQGLDPDTLQPKQAATPGTPQAPPSYLRDGKKYYRDLVEAVQRGDEEGYARVQQQFLMEGISSVLGPAIPLVSDVARTKAVRQVSTEIPDFNSFIDSQPYREVLDSMPLLKDAIGRAESDFSQASQLSDLYKIAYFAGQGRRNLSAAPAQPTTPTQPTARPTTMTSSTLTPPPPTTNPNLTTSDMLRDREARRAWIKEREASGIRDIKF